MGKQGLSGFTDEQILSGLRSYDYGIFTLLYSSYFQNLALASVKYVKDTFIAEGIVQDVFVRIWEQPSLLEGVNVVRPYLYRSVINMSINYVNRQKNIELHHLKIAGTMADESLDDLHEEQEIKKIIFLEIEKLPEQCKRVFKMSRFEGLKYREIAALLNISERTVENHVSNALKILRFRLLEGKGERSGEYKLKLLSVFAVLTAFASGDIC